MPVEIWQGPAARGVRRSAREFIGVALDLIPEREFFPS
jgi:hypothetical protein